MVITIINSNDINTIKGKMITELIYQQLLLSKLSQN